MIRASASSSPEGPGTRVSQWPGWALSAALLLCGAACGREPLAVRPYCGEAYVGVTPEAVTIAVNGKTRLVAQTRCIGWGNEGVTWKARDTSVAAVVEFHDSVGLSVALVVGRGGGTTDLFAIAVADPTRVAATRVRVLPYALEP